MCKVTYSYIELYQTPSAREELLRNAFLFEYKTPPQVLSLEFGAGLLFEHRIDVHIDSLLRLTLMST